MPVQYSISCVSNLFCKQMYFAEPGLVECGHKHNYDHITLLAKGKLKVVVEGKESEFSAPHMIFIKADKHHELTSLEPDTVAYCIHALRDIDGSGDIINPNMIPAGVYSLSMAQDLTTT